MGRTMATRNARVTAPPQHRRTGPRPSGKVIPPVRAAAPTQPSRHAKLRPTPAVMCAVWRAQPQPTRHPATPAHQSARRPPMHRPAIPVHLSAQRQHTRHRAFPVVQHPPSQPPPTRRQHAITSPVPSTLRRPTLPHTPRRHAPTPALIILPLPR